MLTKILFHCVDNILLVPVVGERTAIIIAVMFSLLVLGSMSSVVFASSLIWSQDHGGYYAIAGLTGDVNNNEYTNFWLVKTDELGNIPEFPLLIFLQLFLVFTFVGVLINKRLSV